MADQAGVAASRSGLTSKRKHHDSLVTGPLRRACALVALVGLTSSSAMAGATTLHVWLEHQAHREAGAIGGRHGHDSPDAERHGARDHGRAQQAEAPAHDHALVLVANVEQQSGRVRTTLASVGPGLATLVFALDAPSRAPARISRAGPAARAAPLSRRSVVLQV